MILFYSLKNGKIHLKCFIIQNIDFDDKQENSFFKYRFANQGRNL